MRIEDFDRDTGFAARLGNLSLGFTGHFFATESACGVAIHQDSKEKHGVGQGVVRAVAACSTWALRIRERFINRLRRRHTLATLEGLDWQLLHDIGLSYGDILDLRYGQTSVEQINARKYSKDESTERTCSLKLVPDRHDNLYSGDNSEFRRAA